MIARNNHVLVMTTGKLSLNQWDKKIHTILRDNLCRHCKKVIWQICNIYPITNAMTLGKSLYKDTLTPASPTMTVSQISRFENIAAVDNYVNRIIYNVPYEQEIRSLNLRDVHVLDGNVYHRLEKYAEHMKEADQYILNDRKFSLVEILNDAYVPDGFRDYQFDQDGITYIESEYIQEVYVILLAVESDDDLFNQ